jgi:hypothetical protein
MLLLSRLYNYSSDKFYQFLKKNLLDQVNVELFFNLQENNKNGSVPDAIISQPSFKIVVETKLYSDFALVQLENHLKSFSSENYKVLLTLDPNPMELSINKQLNEEIQKYNTTYHCAVIHRHLTFEDFAKAVEDSIDERDYDMMEVLEDYRQFCYSTGLFANEHKMMHVQLASSTIDINKKLGLYYNDVNRGYSSHSYLGLYSKKAVRIIGKINAIVVASSGLSGLDIHIEKGKLTVDMREKIIEAMEDGINHGYDLSLPNRYFFVEKFYDTFFEKKTPNAPMGTRVFNLCTVLNEQKLPSTEQIAKMLQDHTW